MYLRNFEAKATYACAEGPEGKAFWRRRIGMHEAYTPTTIAKAEAVHDRMQKCAELVTVMCVDAED